MNPDALRAEISDLDRQDKELERAIESLEKKRLAIRRRRIWASVELAAEHVPDWVRQEVFGDPVPDRSNPAHPEGAFSPGPST